MAGIALTQCITHWVVMEADEPQMASTSTLSAAERHSLEMSPIRAMGESSTKRQHGDCALGWRSTYPLHNPSGSDGTRRAAHSKRKHTSSALNGTAPGSFPIGAIGESSRKGQHGMVLQAGGALTCCTSREGIQDEQHIASTYTPCQLTIGHFLEMSPIKAMGESSRKGQGAHINSFIPVDLAVGEGDIATTDE